jgi:hypothetical protein
LSRGSFVDPTADIPDNNEVVHKILLVYEEYTEMTSVQAALTKVGFDVLGITNEFSLGENVLSFNPEVVIALGRGGKVTTLGVGRRLREMTRWQGHCILILPAGYKPNPQDFGKVRADMLLEAPVPVVRLVQVVAKFLGQDEVAAVERLNKQVAPGPNLDGQDPAIIPNFSVKPDNDTVVVSGGLPKDPADRWTLDAEKPARGKEPDLENLWKELTTDPAAQVVTGDAETAASVSFELKDREKELQDQELKAVATTLETAKKTEPQRVAKYAKFTEKLTQFDSRQGLNKVSSRQVQKDLASSWNKTEIESQDKARQEFTKALFRKK